MSKDYIVDSAILPDVMDKVIEARQMLENGTVRQVSEAVKRVGISRGTYYKYKDYVKYGIELGTLMQKLKRWLKYFLKLKQ